MGNSKHKDSWNKMKMFFHVGDTCVCNHTRELCPGSVKAQDIHSSQGEALMDSNKQQNKPKLTVIYIGKKYIK